MHRQLNQRATSFLIVAHKSDHFSGGIVVSSIQVQSMLYPNVVEDTTIGSASQTTLTEVAPALIQAVLIKYARFYGSYHHIGGCCDCKMLSN